MTEQLDAALDNRGMKAQTILDAGDLFLIRTRGLIASMFCRAGVAPTPEDWPILRGERDATMRELAEIAFDLGFQVEFALHSMEPKGDQA